MNNNTRIRIGLPLAALILGAMLGGCGQHPEAADSPTGGAATPMTGHPGAPPSETQADSASGPAAMGGTPGGANGKR